MHIRSIVMMAISRLVQSTVASNPSACTGSTFASLTLSNIDITSFQVTTAYNYSINSTSWLTTGSEGSVEAVYPEAGPTVSTVDICLIEMTYTHPGQNGHGDIFRFGA